MSKQTVESVSKILDQLVEHTDTSYVLVTAAALEGILELALHSNMRSYTR